MRYKYVPKSKTFGNDSVITFYNLSQLNGYQQITIYSKTQWLHLSFDTFLKPRINKKKYPIPTLVGGGHKTPFSG